MYSLSVDIGGTFTDLLLTTGDTDPVVVKIPTSNPPETAVLDAVRTATAKLAASLEPPGRFVHATTLVTNAIVQREGDQTALLTTEGFRDVVEIGRENRFELYDIMIDLPQPLVPRYLRFGVPERTLASGIEAVPLDQGYVTRLAAELVDRGIRAVAVCYLHSFANPAHELKTREILRAAAPDMEVALSCEVVPEIREFPRSSTTIANAYVQRKVAGYLRELAQGVRDAGISAPVFVMQSAGGVTDIATAERFPVRLLESGPAAGAIAAAHAGVASGRPDLLSFDMGGTTAKLCVISHGKPSKRSEFEVDRRYRFKAGSGLPIKQPVMDLMEIGAGGGSIAYRDALGLLKVGPKSAEAQPGPACYGRGGTDPTVTDADLVLGYLDPGFFLGGSMRLDTAAAEAAIDRLAQSLGLSLTEAAWGIHQIANENMANAARVHLAERGKDPRRMPLFAFGGAGPVHSYGVAKRLHLPELIAPLGAGVGSTFGLAVAPVSFEFVRTRYGRLDGLDLERVNADLRAMCAEGSRILGGSPDDGGDLDFDATVDLRYVGQGHEVTVPLPGLALSRADMDQLLAGFVAEYEVLYGRRGPDVPLEATSWRVVVTAPFAHSNRTQLSAIEPGNALKGRRRALIPGSGFEDVPVFDRYRMAPGSRTRGPALIEERESTLVVNGAADISVDEHRNVIVRI